MFLSPSGLLYLLPYFTLANFYCSAQTFLIPKSPFCALPPNPKASLSGTYHNGNFRVIYEILNTCLPLGWDHAVLFITA